MGAVNGAEERALLEIKWKDLISNSYQNSWYSTLEEVTALDTLKAFLHIQLFHVRFQLVVDLESTCSKHLDMHWNSFFVISVSLQRQSQIII